MMLSTGAWNIVKKKKKKNSTERKSIYDEPDSWTVKCSKRL